MAVFLPKSPKICIESCSTMYHPNAAGYTPHDTPVFAALHLPWEHWGGEDIPPFTTSEDRRRVREDRVAEKQRELEEEKEEIERRKREEERERRWVHQGTREKIKFRQLEFF